MHQDNIVCQKPSKSVKLAYASPPSAKLSAFIFINQCPFKHLQSTLSDLPFAACTCSCQCTQQLLSCRQICLNVACFHHTATLWRPRQNSSWRWGMLMGLCVLWQTSDWSSALREKKKETGSKQIFPTPTPTPKKTNPETVAFIYPALFRSKWQHHLQKYTSFRTLKLFMQIKLYIYICVQIKKKTNYAT